MTDEEAYAQVAAELTERNLKPGLWAKALAESVGNENVAKSLYLKFRAEQLLADYQTEKRQRESEELQARMTSVKNQTVSVVRRFFSAVGFLIFGLLTLGCGLGAFIIMFDEKNSVSERTASGLLMLGLASLSGMATSACVRQLR